LISKLMNSGSNKHKGNNMNTFERFGFRTVLRCEPIDGTVDNRVIAGLPITKVNRTSEFSSHGIYAVALAYNYMQLDKGLREEAKSKWCAPWPEDGPRLHDVWFRHNPSSEEHYPQPNPIAEITLTNELGEGDSFVGLLLNHDMSLQWRPKDDDCRCLSGYMETNFPQEPARPNRIVYSSLMEVRAKARLLGYKRITLPAFGTGYLGRNSVSVMKPVSEAFVEELSELGIRNAFAHAKPIDFTYKVKVLTARGEPVIEIPSTAKFPQFHEEINRKLGKPSWRQQHKLVLAEAPAPNAIGSNLHVHGRRR